MNAFARQIFLVLTLSAPLAGGPSALMAQASVSVSAGEAAALIQAHSKGRVLDVRLEERGGGSAYRVKVLLEGGRVRIYYVDADSGRISGSGS
jgi:uncharacterized membrane protein YkoI